MWGFFVGLIVIRPMASPFDNVLQSLIAGLSAFSSLCLLAAAVPFNNNDDFIQSSFSLAETLALASAFLVGVDAMMDITSRFFKLIKFLSVKWCPDDEEAAAEAAKKKSPQTNTGQNSSSTGGNNTGSSSLPNISFEVTPNSSDERQTNTSQSPMVIDSLNADQQRSSSNRRSGGGTTPLLTAHS